MQFCSFLVSSSGQTVMTAQKLNWDSIFVFRAAEHTQPYSVTDSPLNDSTCIDSSNDLGDDDDKEETEKKAANATSEFVGVYRNKRCRQKWEAKIKVADTLQDLGRFDTQEEAARKFDRHASLMGQPVNFPRNSDKRQAIKKHSRSRMA